MKITKFFIKNLYNNYTYDIDFSSNESDIFILTGPNGYGKTTILRLIDSLYKLDFLYFCTIKFEEIKILFDNGDKLIIKKEIQESDLYVDTKNSLKISDVVNFIYSQKNNNSFVFDFSIEKFLKILPEPLLRYTSIESLIQNIKDSANNHIGSLYERYAKSENQEQIFIFFNRINSFFLPAQRLFKNEYVDNQKFFRNRGFEIKNSIEEISENLKQKLIDAQIRYLSSVQKYDNNLIESFFKSDFEYSKSEYDEKVSELQNQVKKLKKFGLIENFKIIPYEENYKKLLSVYLRDCFEKIKSYDSIIEQLVLFSDILNQKSFINKSIRINPSIGIEFFSNKTKETIPSSALSSGEQNEVIMLYHLIFGVKKSSLLLIDEPEISLHIAWQKEFISDLEKIIKDKNIKVVLATHSPQIIGYRWNECYDLSANNLEVLNV